MRAHGPLTREQLDVASAFASELPRFDANARTALALDYERDEGAARLFMEHHFSVLPEAVLESAFGTKVEADLTAAQLVARLVLKRVGLYPSDDASTAIFDYALEGDVTNYVLAVGFSADGEIVAVEMES